MVESVSSEKKIIANMKKDLIIIGLGTNARHVYEFVKYYDLFNVVGFAVNESYRDSKLFYGLPVFSLERLVEEYGSEDFVVFVALLWNHLNGDRKKLYDYCQDRGYEMINLISPKAVVRGTITGNNCWVHDFVIIQNDAVLESDIAIMAYSLIGADTKVGSHCFLELGQYWGEEVLLVSKVLLELMLLFLMILSLGKNALLVPVWL